MMSLLVVALLAAAPDDDAVARAKDAEQRGFAFVEQERWCDALHAFLDANTASPNVDFIFNAALAADYGDDRQRALQLYVELIGAYPDTERKLEVTNRIAALTTKVRDEGAGTSCPAPAGAPDALASSSADATAASTDAPAAPPSTEAASTTIPLAVPLATLGVAAAAAVLGVVLVGVGFVPYLAHAQTRSAILDAEKSGADATELQETQAMWRGAWETWGLASVVGGGLAATVGVVGLAAGGGLTGYVLMGAEEE